MSGEDRARMGLTTGKDALIPALNHLIDDLAKVAVPEQENRLAGEEELLALWKLVQIADGVKLLIEVTVGQALHARLPLSDIAKATGKSTSNVRRDFFVSTQIANLLDAVQTTGNQGQANPGWPLRVAPGCRPVLDPTVRISTGTWLFPSADTTVKGQNGE